jgi:hypothetical protein
MEPWYKVATPRQEVREGRSFSPDEFAIALEQVVAGTAPEDYRNPEQFFSRTCFTRALRDHAGMVLRRLAGKTENTSPVLTLITQFGGGKTHTLTALYHLAKHGPAAARFPGVADLIREAGLTEVPAARVAVFVGNAWDPAEGRETPWIDIARQIAGDDGVGAMGPAAKTTPPGTEAITRLFQVAGGTVLILFDEVLNFLNRHRPMAESFYAFFDNINRATTGTVCCGAVMSLPRSQVEMTDWDLKWQDRVTKVVRRVAKDLIANDETEISEVVRRRLFEDLGSERVRKNVTKAYAEWCFERRAQLPPEWTAVDTTTTEAKGREFLWSRFEACYPFHPATLSVFQRKWQTLPQYQQTRGTLAMLAQWISWAYREGFQRARREPLITLGSAPLDVAEFRSTILGQLGESRLIAGMDVDISGAHAHTRALDADTKGPLRDIHRRVGTTVLFESSGGQVQKVAHLPELRFALGEPDIDTTSIDNAAFALEAKAYYMRRHGSDGFVIHHKPTLKKVVSDRRASLDEDETRTTTRSIVRKEFERGAPIPVSFFPTDSAAIPDSPRLTMVVLEPEVEWSGNTEVRRQIGEWTRLRGTSPRLYPAALVWCVKKPGRDLRGKVELWLAWGRVEQEITEGTLGVDFDRSEQAGVRSKVKDAEEAAKDEVWGGYRFVVLVDNEEPDGLRLIDLGAGHASAAETLCGRVLTALKSQGLLNESVSASYIDRKWPPALKESGAWPLSGLRQSFLNGALTRLVDPDTVLRGKIVEFVNRGDFGLASSHKPDGTYSRVWFNESTLPEDVAFEADVFLLTKEKGSKLKVETKLPTDEETKPESEIQEETGEEIGQEVSTQTKTIRLVGTVPPEIWNRLGTKILPKLRSGSDLKIGVDFTVTLDAGLARNVETELRQALADLNLTDRVHIEGN